VFNWSPQISAGASNTAVISTNLPKESFWASFYQLLLLVDGSAPKRKEQCTFEKQKV
jgi:hypothetical protein